MVTALIDSAPIQFSELTETMLSKLIDYKWIERFRSCKIMQERIALLRSYNVQTQAEESIIQFLVDKFDPPRSSVSYESQVRDELERLEKNGEIIKTPQTEKEWEEKLNDARERDDAEERKTVALHLDNIRKIFPNITEEEFYSNIWKTDKQSKKVSTTPTQTQAPITSKPSEPVNPGTPPTSPQNLPPGAQSLEGAVTTITGIGDVSGERLREAGIYTVRDFMGLTYDQASTILKSPLVAIPFKEYFQKQVIPKTI